MDDIFQCNKAISSLRRQHRWESVLDLVAAMQQLRVTPDTSSLNICIAAHQQSGRPLLKWAPALHLLAELHAGVGVGLRADLISFNTCMCFEGDRLGPFWPLALSLLDETAKRGMTSDLFSFSGVLRACSRDAAGRWVQSCELLASVQQLVNCNVVMQNSVLAACEGAGSWTQALRRLAAMAMSWCLPDVISLTSATSSMGRKWVLALQTLRQLGQVYPNLITWNAILSACSSASSWQHAVSIFLGFTDHGVRPDTISLNSLTCHSDDGPFWKYGLHLVRSVSPQLALSPDEISCNSIMTSSERAGAWRQSLGLSSHMSKMRVRCTVVTLGRTVCAWTRGSQWSQALQAFVQMARAHVRANVITFNNALGACENDWLLVMQLLEELRTSWLASNAVSYSSAANALARSAENTEQKRWPSSLSLWDHMNIAGIASNEMVHNGFINACGGATWNMALDHVFCMVTLRIAPNLISINSAIAACQSISSWLAVLNLFRYMPRAELTPDLISYANAADACARAGQVHPTLKLLKLCDSISWKDAEPTNPLGLS
ncbi:PPR10 [Symbiodinium sp. CCMP2592]|nr:PPR10 [Symbiodinium sp. CCMP2592]